MAQSSLAFMTDQELLFYNQRGFIPGPHETEERFIRRVQAAEKGGEASIPPAHWEWVRHHLRELFDFEPASITAFYSNKNLAPWQGAACWVEEGNVRLQLREAFRKGSYLGLYTREEVLAHEAIHAARAAFEEPENEELFAYAAAEKKWHRLLGPIVKRPWEVWAFIGLIGAGLVWEELFFLGTLWTSLGLGRLWKQQRRLQRATRFLVRSSLCKEKEARAILFRLTDEEIRELGKEKMPQGDDSLRWRLIRIGYLK
jgi:hypothetical protein